MPFPILLGVGIAALVAYALSENKTTPPTDAPPTDTPPNPPEGEPSPETNEGDSPNDNPQLERTSNYDSFVSEYSRTPFHNLIAQTEQAQGIPENLYARQLWQESRLNPEAVGDDGKAVGIAQMWPDAAAEVGVQDRADPSQAIPGGARYLVSLKNQTGDWYSALIAYNWGIGNVKNKGVDNAPPDAIAYANSILADSEA